jgi:(1->4)-alpha-D-glucan 1-alpha-D-glucosylmutase
VSTHDTKRSADVRARLSLLSELAGPWGDAVREWRDHNEGYRRGDAPDPATELVVYQTLVGAWPIEPERLEATILKSIKEAKVRTSWQQPDAAYEDAVLGFVRKVMADRPFLDRLERFLADHDLIRLGRLTSLAQVTLLLTCPGVPDLYQGDELWDLSLVDPDNRRPVDFERRDELLRRLEGPNGDVGLVWPDGSAKLWLIHRLLDHRRRQPEAYQGGYEPLVVSGPAARHAVAFSRGDLVVVVPRLLLALDRTGWGDAAIALPEGRWTSVLGHGGDHAGVVRVGELMEDRPMAVLERSRR